MFLRNDQGFESAGGTAARPFGRALAVPRRIGTIERLRRLDWAPDLGADIGSRDWWRGLATLGTLLGTVWLLAPGLAPLPGAVAPPLDGVAYEEARTQAIAPLAWGGDTGRRMAANDLVAPLAEAPERPRIELSATLGEGDDLDHVLMRAGAGRKDAQAAAGLVAQAVALGDIQPGTRLALTLGPRPTKTVARPLEKLSLRARFDLALSLDRTAAGLAMTRQPIAVDTTPLRIQGLVGSSLYRSARAAGAPARIVESYIKALATRLSIGRDVSAADGFDLIIEQQRAATGEVQLGDLLFAGIDQDRRKLELVRWDDDGRPGWFDLRGQGERRGGSMGMPVAGRITSSFGFRMHPLLGYLKMHKGLDIGAPYGSPIFAALDGVVQGAGRAGGYGNFVKLVHGGGLASGYGHMSRIAVTRGQHVRQGQVIGYVGSTGLSTGPHLHWEVWRNGQTINPRSIAVTQVDALSGSALSRFKTRAASLLAVRPGRTG